LFFKEAKGSNAERSWLQLLSILTSLVLFSSQPVGFVTFSSRVAAEAAKQDLQVRSGLFFPDIGAT